MTDPLDDFEHLNTINRYRNRLDDIRDWKALLPEVMLTISGYSMNLTGVRGTSDRMPGGDALVMTGPWSGDADHGDDLPHPDQVLREWVERLDGKARGSWTENWRWLRDQSPAILGTQWADQWKADIDALWWRLAKLTGNAPEPEPTPEITNGMVIDALRENPDHRLSRKELGIIFGIPASTITTWRSRGLETDEKGSYRAGDILDRLAA